MQFKDKRVLLTGANGGIGKAVAKTFVDAGAVLAVADINVDEVDAKVHLPGDLSDKSYLTNLVPNTIDALGGIDILINNAGINRRGAVTDTTIEDFDASVDINVKAPYVLCRAAITHMAQHGGGAIVNVSSCWGVRPGPEHAVYCMSKAAIASLTQCMGRDHAHQGIRVNAVCPNEVNTPMLRTGFEMRGFDPDTAVQELGKTVPLGHIAEPEEIADVIAFLASTQSRYICGELIEVNGGKPVS